MLISRLTSQLAKAMRFTGHFLPRPVSSVLCSGPASANYSTQPSHNNGGQPHRWHALDPELEEMLVPRKMSISPLESWLTVRYSFPKVEVINVHKKIGYEPTQQYDCPTSEVEADVEEEGGDLSGNKVECRNVLKIRRRKMNQHKYKKLRKRRKVLWRAVLENRKKKRQIKFEQALTHIWKRAGLKKPPEEWQTPKLFMRKSK
ncbi:PREDICTED: aurora kinase A-interacting protein [Gavialis gangeticus]|uniref:aurora kinase A-interacting protein n=1 Tax=Gavialis gangeticus TaxID=94835 RepID=UPI00092EE35B|nr:PREDICTED: aurora kinase A-interacting protein [Gavialis gangeticus]XP_019367384.1 PREDICTED: aurora kinase A-interacting protein [Gavialis gangeticus]